MLIAKDRFCQAFVTFVDDIKYESILFMNAINLDENVYQI